MGYSGLLWDLIVLLGLKRGGCGLESLANEMRLIYICIYLYIYIYIYRRKNLGVHLSDQVLLQIFSVCGG